MFNNKKKDNSLARRSPNVVNQRNKAFSYYNSRLSTSETSQTRRRPGVQVSKPRKLKISSLKNVPTVIAIIVLISCVIYELHLSSNPRVIIVDNTNSAQSFIQSSSYYQNSIQKILRSSTANNNKLTINVSSLATILDKKFPEIDNVSIVLPILGNRPIVYLQPDYPELVLSSQSKYSILDQSGKVLQYISNPSIIPTLKLPVVSDSSNITTIIGNVALPSSYISFIQTLDSQLQYNHLTVQSMNLPAASEELDVHFNGIPYYVKFNLNDTSDADQQIGTFLAARQYLSQNNITPSQYIDARVLGRVYYK